MFEEGNNNGGGGGPNLFWRGCGDNKCGRIDMRDNWAKVGERGSWGKGRVREGRMFVIYGLFRVVVEFCF